VTAPVVWLLDTNVVSEMMPRLSHSLLASALSSFPRYMPGLPCPAGKQAHGHPAGAPAVSVKTAARDSGRTGPDGSRCCCCGSCGCSCCGWRNASSSHCCSRNRPESRAGCALACSLVETYLNENSRPQRLGLRMTGMAYPALYRCIDGRPVNTPCPVRLAHAP